MSKTQSLVTAWTQKETAGRMERMARLLVECRDALPAISQVSAKLHNVDLTLADRVETVLEPWLLP